VEALLALGALEPKRVKAAKRAGWGVEGMPKNRYRDFMRIAASHLQVFPYKKFLGVLGDLHHLTRENEFQERLWPTDTPISGAVSQTFSGGPRI
jgi:hypothetical protein